MTSPMPLIEQNQVVPATSSGTLGFSLGTGSTQVLPGNNQVRKITFANPGSVTIYVCPALDANGAALTAGPSPGNIPIVGGGVLTVTGNGVAGAWLAAAASSSSNPFTVSVSQTL